MKTVDYSVYLVTGRNLLPPNKEYLDSLEESIQGGVTIVQIREKELDTNEFIELARLSKIICDKYNVPLLINDRVDVALAIGADGVHVGQKDMPVELVRKLLPPGSIVGVSCNTIAHVKEAVRSGVDYIGIGAVWGTQTKKLTEPIIGVRGVGAMLEELVGTNVKVVAIGGIKSMNLLRTLHGTMSMSDKALDGVAIVSDIVASPVPRLAAKRLQKIYSEYRQYYDIHPFGVDQPASLTADSVMTIASELMTETRTASPLIHQITNIVVTTQSANVTLAVGASPIMATEPKEMQDMTRIAGALLINIGSLHAHTAEAMLLAGAFANAFRKPVVFDPVGVGASVYRKEHVRNLLDTFQVSVIKGNAGELAALAGTTEVESKGVDSVGPGFKDPETFVKNLAIRERCVIVLTGPTDYISDGQRVAILQNGPEELGRITGSGCILGSLIASFCATAALMARKDLTDVESRLILGDMFAAAITGVLVLTVAAELAVESGSVKGPGTFLPALIDSLWALTPEHIAQKAKFAVKGI
ncbi:thiamine biosynthetic bifunctional enzyme Thi4 [Pholiota conissans]|uniref:Thiamine biosynthetic bifunctional enzyme Thi4 n=1 Tax=Pholiota conissans TaxID=109636 RepID=A0A9P6D0W5_9AGAR|nr:thiamine biosynthetic bifunctional enzyme Thi4 [Pholiota conissans]